MCHQNKTYRRRKPATFTNVPKQYVNLAKFFFINNLFTKYRPHHHKDHIHNFYIFRVYLKPILDNIFVIREIDIQTFLVETFFRFIVQVHGSITLGKKRRHSKKINWLTFPFHATIEIKENRQYTFIL